MDDENCAICLEKIRENNIRVLGCGHVFCSSCIQMWKKRSGNCPFCRKNMCQGEEDDLSFFTVPIIRCKILLK